MSTWNSRRFGSFHGSAWFAIVSLMLGWTLALASPAQARVAVVETNGGRMIEGELVRRNNDEVVLKVSGITTPISRSDIKSVTMKKSPQEIYDQRKSQLKDDDMDGRFNLAYDLYKMGAFDLASKEARALDQAFADHPDNQRIKGLLETIDTAQKRKQRQQMPQNRANGSRGANTANTSNSPNASNTTAPATAPGSARPNHQSGNDRLSRKQLRQQQLTDEQINLLKIWELPSDLEQARVQIRVPREVIEKVLEQYAQQQAVPKGRQARNRLRQADGWQQLGLLFDLHARQFYPKVQVIGTPRSLLQYRQYVGPQYVNNYFRRQFGTGQVQGLRLFGDQPNQPRSAYTNFYILSQFKTRQADMIDRQQPDKSLLLQWGLPRNEAAIPAPNFSGWEPYFVSSRDPRYQRIRDWIAGLYVNPDYGIDYTPPGAKSNKNPNQQAGPQQQNGSSQNARNQPNQTGQNNNNQSDQ